MDIQTNYQESPEQQPEQQTPQAPQKKKGSKIFYQLWRAIWPFLASLALNFIISFGFSMMFSIVYVMRIGAQSTQDTAALTQQITEAMMSYMLPITLVWQILVVILGGLLFRGDWKKILKSQGGVREKIEKSPFVWCMIVVCAIFTCIALNYWITISGLMEMFPGFEQIANDILYNGSVWLQIVVMCIGAPLSEELLFRGLFFKRLRGIMPYWGAALLTAVLFGLNHGNVVQFIYAFLLSLILTYIYEKCKTLWAPILFHVAANACSVFISNVWTGDELSIPLLIVSTVIMLGSIAAMILFFRREGRQLPLDS